MGLAIDTVGLTVTSGTAATAAYLGMTAANGDSLTVRSFNAPASALLEEILYDASTVNAVRVRSPMFHDDVQGIRFTPGVAPVRHQFAPQAPQRLISGDTLIAEVNDQTANAVYVAGLRIYYSDLIGGAARLKNPGDVLGNIKSVKPVLVTVTTPTAKVWTDTSITTTENLLHANTDYAVLGYLVDSATCLVGVKGQETSNLRVCGSGQTELYDTSNLFVDLANALGTPHIPVFNSQNASNYYVSVFPRANTTLNVTLILAEMASPVP